MAKQRQQTAELEERKGSELSPSQFTFKKYNAVVQSAELLDLRLTSSSFKAESEYYLLKRQKVESKQLLKFEMSGSLREFKYIEDEGVMFGDFEWLASSRKGRKQLLSIKSRYLLVYTAASGLEDRYVQAYLANVGKFATFPYFRALVSAYSAAASADLPILPVLKERFTTAPDEEKQEV